MENLVRYGVKIGTESLIYEFVNSGFRPNFALSVAKFSHCEAASVNKKFMGVA